MNISYDRSLAATREILLRRHGFEVTSVFTLAKTIEVAKTCEFDLAILGHSIPLPDKREIARAIHECNGHIYLLSLLRTGTEPIPEADSYMEANEGPQALLRKVEEIFENHIEPQRRRA